MKSNKESLPLAVEAPAASTPPRHCRSAAQQLAAVDQSWLAPAEFRLQILPKGQGSQAIAV